MLIISLFYIFILRRLGKYKVVKYLRVFFNKKHILIIIIFALISNTYMLYLNSRYNKFYENTPEIISAKAIVIRRPTRKRIYRYVYNKN